MNKDTLKDHVTVARGKEIHLFKAKANHTTLAVPNRRMVYKDRSRYSGADVKRLTAERGINATWKEL